MSLLDLFQRKSDPLPGGDRHEIITRYKRLREVNKQLNSKLLKGIGKDEIDEGGRKLGMLQRGVLVLDSENEMAVLMDYCLFDVRRKGRTRIEQYLIDTPPDPESDEMTCLRAMQHTVYSLFVVDAVHRGMGVTVTDLLSNQTLLVVDLGFGSSAEPGLVFASRLILHDGFSMTSGASLPVSVLSPEARDGLIRELARIPDDQGARDPAPFIRSLLSRGSSARIRYQDANGSAAVPPRVASQSPSTKVGRNTACPCGSGRKFKHCCMNSP